MKFKTTAKAVKAHTIPVSFGYCELQHILQDYPPMAYTCGVYGWNADIYPTPSAVVVVTGYRPFGREPNLTYDQVREYDRKAADIWSYKNPDPYEVKKAKVAELRAEFFGLI